jgi:hypothetical protein
MFLAAALSYSFNENLLSCKRQEIPSLPSERSFLKWLVVVALPKEYAKQYPPPFLSSFLSYSFSFRGWGFGGEASWKKMMIAFFFAEHIRLDYLDCCAVKCVSAFRVIGGKY